MRKYIASLAVVFCLASAFFLGAIPVVAMETGPTPDPPEPLWMYIWEDIDGDGKLERIYFLTRDEYLFGSVFQGMPPFLPYDDTPGQFSGDNVGLRSPGYQVISDTSGTPNVQLEYQIQDVSSAATFVSDTGGTLTTVWEDNDVRLTREADLDTSRLLLTFTVRNLGMETLEDISFVEKHRFDDGQFIFNGDKYKGGQLIGIDHPGEHDLPVMGMVYAPVPDLLEIEEPLDFDPSTATFLLGDLASGEEASVQLAVVWSTSDDPEDAFDEVVEKMLEMKRELRIIEANIECHPETLNLKSKGKWVMCIIELPEYLDESDIDPSTVRLQGTIPAEHPILTGHSLNVKFERLELEELLTAGDDIVLTVSGELYDGMRFVGTDIIDAIH
jgi:hypothetical protein